MSLVQSPEAARALNVSRQTLWRMTKRGQLPSACYFTNGTKRPRTWYDLEALRAWMNRPA